MLITVTKTIEYKAYQRTENTDIPENFIDGYNIYTDSYIGFIPLGAKGYDINNPKIKATPVLNRKEIKMGYWVVVGKMVRDVYTDEEFNKEFTRRAV